MPRPLRIEIPDGIYHIINRANHRSIIFAKSHDYSAFEDIIFEGLKKYSVQIYAYVIMPNHWHLVLSPKKEGELARYLHWITTTHVHRWNEVRRLTGNGHLYQGRYRSFLVESGEYFLTLCRYVEGNPVRASLAASAEKWRWSSLWHRQNESKQVIKFADWPIDVPRGYIDFVNKAFATEDKFIKDIALSMSLGVPYGSLKWKKKLPEDVCPKSRPRGRPVKVE